MKKPIELPETIEACHAMIIAMAQQIAQLQRRAFSSLKDRTIKYDGPSLFEEYDKEAELARKKELDKAKEEVDAAARTRREKARKDTQARRPAKYNTYGLPEVERTVMPEGVGNVEDYEIIGTDTTRLLHMEPARMWVEKIVRPILRLKSEKDALAQRLVQAPAPRCIIGGNHVAADLLASLVVNKYAYHLPEYRQVRMMAEMGAGIPPSTINDWIHRTAQALYPLYESQCEAVLSSRYLQVDETPWKIADQKGKPCRNGYAWQFRDVSAHSRGTFFYYHKGSRAGEIARAQLRDFRGTIQTDGYKVYHYLDTVPGVTTLACWAHVRRKFVEAQPANPLAGEVVNYIATLYTLEENLQEAGADFEQIKAERQRLAVPILDGIEAWMHAAYATCTPKEPLAKAIQYALSLWPRLKRYTEDGRYRIDSNPVERGQRPSALGRKNYLFSQNDRGAEDNAIFYTLLVCCDIFSIPPLQWLTDVLNRIHTDMEEDELVKLLPCNYKKAD